MVLVGQVDDTRARLQDAGQTAQQGRLPGAVGTDDGQSRPGRDGEFGHVQDPSGPGLDDETLGSQDHSS
jgi:hypothetical protein